MTLNATPYLFRRRRKAREAAAQRRIPTAERLAGPSPRTRSSSSDRSRATSGRRDLTTSFSVPDAALRGGDFSKATNNAGAQQNIYNPFTGGANGVGRVPFDGQQDSVEHDQSDCAEGAAALPAAEHHRVGPGGFTRKLRARRIALDGSGQLRPQGQLEPHGAPTRSGASTAT